MVDDSPERSSTEPPDSAAADEESAGATDDEPPADDAATTDDRTPTDDAAPTDDAGGGSAAGEGDAGGGSEHDVTAFTTDVRTLDPAVRWLWVGRAVLLGLFLGGVSAGIALAVAPGYVWVGGGVFGLAAVLGSVHALLLYRSWEYRIREDSVYLHRGVITRVQTVVPYVRVQHIDTSRGPIERAAGLSSLVIYTAGSRGADVTVPGLVPEESSDLQTRLKMLAIESEGEDAV